ncbi:glycosyltransferase family 39 protein [Chitinophagaceae bacterium LB-8]|uniref:Glycosyltransferase family 39 protein n=1 Tax=Paraflavisolibacter caeni TaxID=2982496 RepID=A0A9X3B7A8_9BACT|nr:glycosyltransferase family 39 protein [Paraflavisolibacter caeni]MCU7548301.1 glycosyltransferase family 39 protein [Paraflavisolibacter caeni]
MKSNKTALFIILAVSIILLFSFLGKISVFQVAEARNAECANEMFARHDWITPVFNGQLRTDKPALEYFAMITAYHLFGVNEFSARFFSAVCGLLVVLCTFLFTKRHFGQNAAVWTSIVLLSSIHAIIQFRLATPDPYLILAHVLSLYCFWEGWQSGKWRWYAAMYLLLGLGVLAKGPVGLLLPALTIALFLLLKKKLSWNVIKEAKPWYGIILALAVCLPWYLLVHFKTGGAWTTGFFMEHNVGRFDKAVDGHSGFFLLPLVFVFLGMFPFSVFSVRTFSWVWKERKQNDLLFFLLVAATSIVIFYSFSSTKLLNYTTPAYPFLAILIGCWLNKVSGQPIKASFEWAFITLIAIAIPVGTYLWSANTDPVKDIAWIAYPLAILPAGVLLAILSKQSLLRRSLLVAVASMCTTFLLFSVSFPALDKHTVFRMHKQELKQGEEVVAYKKFNDGFVFYNGHPIPVVNSQEELDSFLNKYHHLVVLSTTKNDFDELNKNHRLHLQSKVRDLFSSKYSAIYFQLN